MKLNIRMNNRKETFVTSIELPDGIGQNAALALRGQLNAVLCEMEMNGLMKQSCFVELIEGEV